MKLEEITRHTRTRTRETKPDAVYSIVDVIIGGQTSRCMLMYDRGEASRSESGDVDIGAGCVKIMAPSGGKSVFSLDKKIRL